MDNIERDNADREDMRRLNGGQETALNNLMDRHAEHLFHFLFRMLGDEDDARDLAQETFVRVFNRASTYRPEHRFTTWLYTIAGNLARNHHRWEARHPTLSLESQVENSSLVLGDVLPDTASSPDTDASQHERLKAVQAAVESLPAELREAVILCEWQELSVKDAAQVTHSTPKAVESRLYRARKQLRGLLADWL